MRTLTDLRAAALVVLFVIGTALAGVGAPRTDVLLSTGWKFSPSLITPADLDSLTTAIQEVTLPHTWNAVDGADGGNNYRRGPGSYLLTYTAPGGLADKQLYLRFEGAATVTTVTVNGAFVGTHSGNFGAFCFDVTDKLKPAATNQILVNVDNSLNLNIPPLSGDFTVFGGLYRPVRLVATEKLAISPQDHAGPGVAWQQESVSDTSAMLRVSAVVRNSTRLQKHARLKFMLLDDTSKTVASCLLEAEVPAAFLESSPVGVDRLIASDAKCATQLTVPNPHLWNGRKDPYLYRGVVEVYDGEKLCDRVEQRIGLRYYRVDAEKGFFLNGKSYPLHGVNRHQDREGKGWAIGEAEHREDAHIIYEMGCTGIRLAHYQHAQQFYDLCDELGLVVWAELALVDRVSTTTAFNNNAKQQLTELITQSGNHASICFWSLYNELGLRQKPPYEHTALIRELNQLAHQLDPTRPTCAASHNPNDRETNTIPDLIAFNHYDGWYTGMPNDWSKTLDDYHTSYTGHLMGVSEYGAGASINQHEIPPQRPKAGGPWHPEEWQSLVHETAWRAMKVRPWLWGTFVWNGFDFAADQRKEGDHEGRNDKGLVTYDRKTRKDAYYFYQANWTEQPMVHICSRRYNPRPAGETTVTVYSNCDAVQLSVNGAAAVPMVNAGDGVFRVERVEVRAGENQLLAVGKKSGTEVRDEIACTANAGPGTNN